MSGVLQRMRGFFNRDARTQRLPPGSYPNPSGDRQPIGTITKPPDIPDDDDEEDNQSVTNYNIPEQTRLKGQQRDTLKSDDTTRSGNPYGSGSSLPPGQLNPSNTQSQGAPSGFNPSSPNNSNSNNPPSNTNTGNMSDPQSRAGLSFLQQIRDPSSRPPLNPVPTSTNNPPSSFGGFPPGMNVNQSSAPPPTNNPPSSFGGFPPGMNVNQSSAPPPTNNPPSSFGGFPPGMNANQSLPPPPPTNNQSSSFRGFPPGMNPNQSAAPPPYNSSPPFGGFPPGMNANQSSPPPPSNNRPTSFPGFPPGMNMNPNQSSPPPAANNRSMSFRGFPPGMNPQSLPSTPGPSMNNPNNFMNNPQRSLTRHMDSFRNQSNNNDDNVSRLEVDYPIENILVDANIPSAVAVKINETVEQDRLGNAYHIHRYTFEPSSQHMSFRNPQHSHHRRPGGHIHHGGTRHIREIHNKHYDPLFSGMINPHPSNRHSHHRQHHHHSETSLDDYIDRLLHAPGSIVIQAKDSSDLNNILTQHLPPNQTITQQLTRDPFPSNNMNFIQSNTMNPIQSNTNSSDGPVFYYTAQALSNDPMRGYYN